MFGFGTYWGGIFFSKRITRAASKKFSNLRDNFALFGDSYFAIAPLWELHENEFTTI